MDPLPPELSPLPQMEPLPRRSGRAHHFPTAWKDFEATSYTPHTDIPVVDPALFEQHITPPAPTRTIAILTPPNIITASPSQLPLDEFCICWTFNTPQNPPTILGQMTLQLPTPHPFRNDSILKALALCQGHCPLDTIPGDTTQTGR
jgi:hypothetical protein